MVVYLFRFTNFIGFHTLLKADYSGLYANELHSIFPCSLFPVPCSLFPVP
ncbi:hypothetical protein [Moorena sp. SIO3H5]|nr:hypothetical protein [Moorena sp. SIO3H5]NEO70739.1 hypothetical protein [Moorena sp. SIO3H5]